MMHDRDRWKERAERLESLCPSDATPCSASSDTPETDDAELPVMTWPSQDNPMVTRSTLTRKLERERNAERKLADQLANALTTTRWDSPVKRTGAMNAWNRARNNLPQDDTTHP